MEFKNIRVFVGVPAIGKSFLTKQNNRFVDMDTLKAKYKYALEECSEKEIEWLKGNHGKTKRNNFLEYIENQTKYLLNNTDKILLFAPNPQIVDMIYKNNIAYCLVFHAKNCIDEIAARMRKRGNQENFIKDMTEPINEFYSASISDCRPAFKIELRKGEFLSDVFKNPDKFLNREFLY